MTATAVMKLTAAKAKRMSNIDRNHSILLRLPSLVSRLVHIMSVASPLEHGHGHGHGHGGHAHGDGAAGAGAGADAPEAAGGMPPGVMMLDLLVGGDMAGRRAPAVAANDPSHAPYDASLHRRAVAAAGDGSGSSGDDSDDVMSDYDGAGGDYDGAGGDMWLDDDGYAHGGPPPMGDEDEPPGMGPGGMWAGMGGGLDDSAGLPMHGLPPGAAVAATLPVSADQLQMLQSLPREMVTQLLMSLMQDQQGRGGAMGGGIPPPAPVGIMPPRDGLGWGTCRCLRRAAGWPCSCDVVSSYVAVCVAVWLCGCVCMRCLFRCIAFHGRRSDLPTGASNTDPITAHPSCCHQPGGYVSRERCTVPVHAHVWRLAWLHAATHTGTRASVRAVATNHTCLAALMFVWCSLCGVHVPYRAAPAPAPAPAPAAAAAAAAKEALTAGALAGATCFDDDDSAPSHTVLVPMSFAAVVDDDRLVFAREQAVMDRYVQLWLWLREDGGD